MTRLYYLQPLLLQFLVYVELQSLLPIINRYNLAQKRVPEHTIQTLDHWNSQAYKSYIRCDNNYRAKVWSITAKATPNNNIIFDH